MGRHAVKVTSNKCKKKLWPSQCPARDVPTKVTLRKRRRLGCREKDRCPQVACKEPGAQRKGQQNDQHSERSMVSVGTGWATEG